MDKKSKLKKQKKAEQKALKESTAEVRRNVSIIDEIGKE